MNTEKINFQTKDLLTCEEIEALVISPYPNDKAIIITSKLLNYFIINHEEYYRYDIENVLYIKEDNNKDYIITIITRFIEISFKSLPKVMQENLQLKYKKTLDKIFSNADIGKYISQLSTYITNNKIDFSDPQLLEIHFNNGYYCFKTGTFKKRVHGTHFINVFIHRDYVVPTEEEKIQVMVPLKQIYSHMPDLNYLLMTMGIAITGMSCIEQTMLFLLGLGSSGKSTVIEMVQLALNNEYVYNLPKETFSKGNPTVAKTLNTYITKRCIRISYINEPEDTKINESLFKDHCDGKIQTTSLYKDGANDFRHFSKMVFISNDFPNIKIDSGSVRRIESFTHTSKFTSDEDLVDESKQIYLKNQHLLTNLAKNPEQQNALFTILAEYGYNWLTKKTVFKQTKNFQTTKDTIVSSNDIIQDFIDKCFRLTKRDCDRVGKEEMYTIFKTNFPRSLMTPQQLLGSLKQKEIIYNAEYRHKATNTRGCYVGIILKGENLPISIFDARNSDIIDSTDNGIDKMDKSVDVVKLMKIEHAEIIADMKLDYENKINALKKQLENIQPVETIEIVKPIDIISEVIKPIDIIPEVIKPIQIISENISKNAVYMNINFQHAEGYKKREYRQENIDELVDIGVHVISKELDIDINNIETFIYEQPKPILNKKHNYYEDGLQIQFTHKQNPNFFNFLDTSDRSKICQLMWEERVNVRKNTKIMNFHYAEPSISRLDDTNIAPLGGKDKQYSITMSYVGNILVTKPENISKKLIKDKKLTTKKPKKVLSSSIFTNSASRVQKTDTVSKKVEFNKSNVDDSFQDMADGLLDL